MPSAGVLDFKGAPLFAGFAKGGGLDSQSSTPVTSTPTIHPECTGSVHHSDKIDCFKALKS
jgi:hypothetical protein